MKLITKWEIESAWGQYTKMFYWLTLSFNNWYFYIPTMKLEWRETYIYGGAITFRNVEIFGIEIMEMVTSNTFFFHFLGITFSRSWEHRPLFK